MSSMYGIDEPRPFQIEGMNHCAFNDDTYLVIIHPTANGKSLIPLAAASIRCGVAIVIVPLIGLGSNQVDKPVLLEHNNGEAYHADEMKSVNTKLLCERLLGATDAEVGNISVMVYILPQGLSGESSWLKLFEVLAKRGHLSLFCVDKAHNVEQAGDGFLGWSFKRRY